MNKIPTANVAARLGGRYKVRVLDGASKRILSETPWQKNLVLNPGLVAVDGGTFFAETSRCRAGTGTTPSKATLDGTFALSGTTLTRSTGTGVFSAGDVNKYVKFGTGEEHLITAYTSATEVTVRDSATVAATTLEIYDTARTALDAEVIDTTTLNGDPGAQSTTATVGTGNYLIHKTYDFAVEVGTVNYNEIGVAAGTGDLFSRIVLSSTVTVNAGQQLQVVYELSLTCDTWLSLTAITPTITGWAWEYTNLSITSTPTDFTVTTDENHHYSAGDEITIAGATPAGYNGTWTIASVTADTIVVTDASDLGTDSAPGTTTGSLAGDVRFGSGTGRVCFGDSSALCEMTSSLSSYSGRALQEANIETVLGLGAGNLSNTATIATRAEAKTSIDTTDFSFERTFTFDIDEANWTDLRQLIIQGGPGNNSAGIVMTFDQNQRKDSGYTLKIGYKATFRQDLP